MPRPTRWRDLSKITKSGLALYQYRLTVPGTNTELVLASDMVTQKAEQPTRWTVRRSACRMPETMVITKQTDIASIQTEAICTVQAYLTEQKAIAETMLAALPPVPVGTKSQKSKKPADAGQS